MSNNVEVKASSDQSFYRTADNVFVYSNNVNCRKSDKQTKIVFSAQTKCIYITLGRNGTDKDKFVTKNDHNNDKVTLHLTNLMKRNIRNEMFLFLFVD